MEAAPEWADDDQRPTDPCLPGEDWAAPALGATLDASLAGALRPAAIPHELLDTERDARGLREEPKPASPSGIRTVVGRPLLGARAGQRR
jgi:hypothetical protein